MNLRPFAALTVCLIGAIAGAQSAGSSDQIGIRIGYGFSGEYEKRNGDTVRTEGPELALQIPVGESRGLQFFFEPSFFGGGRLRHGADSDGDVYRATIYARKSLAGGAYAQIGGGFAHFADRANQAKSEDSVIAQFGVGVPIRGIQTRYSPSFEVNVFASPRAQLSGLFFGIVGHV